MSEALLQRHYCPAEPHSKYMFSQSRGAGLLCPALCLLNPSQIHLPTTAPYLAVKPVCDAPMPWD